MFDKGDIVSIPFSLLFDDYQDELDVERENFPFNYRELVYGVVSVGNTRGQYFVRWNVEGIFGIQEDEAQHINNIIYDEVDLELVRCKDDRETDQDPQIGLFFDHDGEMWHLVPPEDLCDPFTCTGRCKMQRRKYKFAIKQLFLHLSLPRNAHMQNRQKRFVCYRYYTRIRYGVLRSGDRRALCPCVEREIELWFPPPFGERRVGFHVTSP